MLTVAEPERLTLLRLIHDPYHTTDGDPYPLLVTLGFDAATLEPLRHKLSGLCRVLFDPFSSQMRFDLQFWRQSERISDPQVQRKIQRRGIVLKTLVRKARASRYAPQPVFSLHEGLKRCEVWLE